VRDTGSVRIHIEGESWLTLEAISECYGCEVAWLQEAYEFGLLGNGRVHLGQVLLRVVVLDRVADLVRLGVYQGLTFETMAAMLGDDPLEAFRVSIVVES